MSAMFWGMLSFMESLFFSGVEAPVYFYAVPGGTLFRRSADDYSMFAGSSRKKKGGRGVFLGRGMKLQDG